MRRLLTAIFGLAAVPQPQVSTNLPQNTIIEAVADLSGGDQAAIAAARRALRDGPADRGAFADLPADMRAFTVIAGSLEETGRLISLDWKDDLPEAQAKFTALFAKYGLGADDAPERIARIADQSGESGVGVAYAAFRAMADEKELRIVSLNADSDMYHFTLVQKQQAERWESVRIGPNQYIEDSDRHFLDVLEAIGVSPRSRGHPSKTTRPPPVTN